MRGDDYFPELGGDYADPWTVIVMHVLWLLLVIFLWGKN